MKNKIIKPNPYGAINLEKLEAFEKKIGTILPEEYRKYLIQYNGGEFENTYFDYKEKFLFITKDATIHIHEVNALVDQPEWASLEDDYKNYNEDFYENGYSFKDKYLAIMSDDSGNRIVIKLKDPQRGAIYFWDHENPSRKVEKALTKVANSFNEFIDHMISEEEWLEGLKVRYPEEYEMLTRVVDRRAIEIYQYKSETFYFVPYSEVQKSYNMQPHAPVLSYNVQMLDNAESFAEAFKEAISFSRSDLTQEEFDAIRENNVFPLNEDEKFKSNTSVVNIFTNDGIEYNVCSTKLYEDGEYYHSGPSSVVHIDASDTELFEAFKKAMIASIELKK